MRKKNKNSEKQKLKPIKQCFGSGSASGNVDLDPGTKTNRDKLAYKSTKIKFFFFF